MIYKIRLHQTLASFYSFLINFQIHTEGPYAIKSFRKSTLLIEPEIKLELIFAPKVKQDTSANADPL